MTQYKIWFKIACVQLFTKALKLCRICMFGFALFQIAPALFSNAQIITITSAAETDAQSSESYEMLKLFSATLQKIREDYVEKVSDKELIEAALRGMLASLDPHSTYLDSEQLKEMQTDTRGEFGGLGIEITMDESGYIRIVSPIDDTPASKAGLLSGDLITHINSEHVQGMTLNDAVGKMRGKIGTDITITIAREESPPFDVSLERGQIPIIAVKSRIEEGVGYVRIMRFNGQTQSGLEKAFKKMDTENLQGFILDLRNNPGGLLDQAISTSDSFLNRGEIVSTRGRNTGDINRWQAQNGDLAKGLPIVVLINQGSASASEIVAGALQDHKRAVILGTKSFGKGSVQTILPLSDDHRAAIKLTTQRYYTPSGRSIQALGITPDILVQRTMGDSADQQKFTKEADLNNALENANAREEQQEIAPRTEEVRNDYQLSRALDIIHAFNIYDHK